MGSTLPKTPNAKIKLIELFQSFCENVPIKMTIFITNLLTNFSNSDLALSYNGLKITTQITNKLLNY